MIIFSLLAFLGFFIAAIAHISTFFNVDLLAQFPALWGLHIGAIILCIPMAIATKGFKSKGSQKTFWNDFFAPMPAWSRLFVKLMFAYTLVNFALFIMNTAKVGSPVEENGKYLLKQRGQATREVTKAEYDDSQRLLLRGFSGHWMLFFLLPALYFLYPRPRRIS